MNDRTTTVRPVEARDSAAWLRMRVALWPDDTEAEHSAEVEKFFRGEMMGAAAVLLAFDASDSPVGFAELSIRPCAEGCRSDRIAYLEGWYVAPEARRRGIGRALVAAGEAWGRSQGCTEFASDTQPTNRASAAAHYALGFTEAGVVHCFRKDL